MSPAGTALVRNEVRFSGSADFRPALGWQASMIAKIPQPGFVDRRYSGAPQWERKPPIAAVSRVTRGCDCRSSQKSVPKPCRRVTRATISMYLIPHRGLRLRPWCLHPAQHQVSARLVCRAFWLVVCVSLGWSAFSPRPLAKIAIPIPVPVPEPCPRSTLAATP